jgi:hypothetical protein
VSILAKIYAPNERYAGVTAGVSFTNGAGETEDKWLMQWFQYKGYKVVEEKKEIKEKKENTKKKSKK